MDTIFVSLSYIPVVRSLLNPTFSQNKFEQLVGFMPCYILVTPSTYTYIIVNQAQCATSMIPDSIKVIHCHLIEVKLN